MGKKKNKALIEKEKDELVMATQIAATPIICGKQAKSILREVKTAQSEKAKRNATRLAEYFSKFDKKN
jgi:hypothetical protein